MQLLRQYKLHRLGIPIDSKYLNIFKFVDSKFLNLQKFEMEGYPSVGFYMDSKNSAIIQFNTVNKYVGIKYIGFWEVLESRYGLQEEDIRDFIKNISEYVYKIKGDNVYYYQMYEIESIESSYVEQKSAHETR